MAKSDWFVGLAALAGAGLFAHMIHEGKQRREEDERRRNTPYQFSDYLPEATFGKIVNWAGNQVKRVYSLNNEGPFIYGKVISQSGISEWRFMLDFNDYGSITGRYWLTSENEDSTIPERIGDLIQTTIYKLRKEHQYSVDESDYDYEDTNEEVEYCSRCGRPIEFYGAIFCAYCGNRL